MGNNENYNKAMQQVKRAMQEPFRPDKSFTNMQNQIMANSAFEMSRITQETNDMLDAVAERNARNDEAIQRTAQESVEHTKLLEKQLQEVQTQNELLRTEAMMNKAETEASRKATKQANRLSILALVLSTILSVGGIISSILIALYL